MQLQLHYANYTTLQLQLHYTTTTTTAALHHTTSSSCGWGDRPGDHCNHCNHSKKHNSNHLSVHQWVRSAIRDSQQPTSPIGFLFLKLPPLPCAVLLVWYDNVLSVFSSDTLEPADSHLYIRHSQGSILWKLNHPPQEPLLWKMKNSCWHHTLKVLEFVDSDSLPRCKISKFCLLWTGLT